MKKTYCISLAIVLAFSLHAQEEETIKKRKGDFYFGYSFMAPFIEYIGTIPDETFHTSSFFSPDFPFIKPDEPDNHIYFRYVFRPKELSKWSYGFGIEYLHTKPNRFDKGAGVLEGLYLGDGYTQLGLGVGVNYQFSKDIFFSSFFSTGPMVSNPDWEGKTYIPYKVLTPFLVNKYQITGWGATNTTMATIQLGKWFLLSATLALHYDKSRALRATDGTSGSFAALVHSFGLGVGAQF